MNPNAMPTVAGIDLPPFDDVRVAEGAASRANAVCDRELVVTRDGNHAVIYLAACRNQQGQEQNKDKGAEEQRTMFHSSPLLLASRAVRVTV
jgi:hypothetical protein